MTPKPALKLLVVDDDPMIRRAIARAAEDPDYEILLADAPTAALELLAKNAVQVVISDQHMRGARGTDFLAIVEAKYPEIVRILLTSDTSKSVFVSAVNKGQARRVLYKPWNDEQLHTIVRQALGLPVRRAAVQPELKESAASQAFGKIASLLSSKKG